jgi:hypothetical protein
MSQYLSFDLVNKANPEIKVDLGYWCTSIARGISYEFGGIFPYTEINVNIDYDTLKSYIENIQKGIESYKKHLCEAQEKKKENLELLLKAQTQVVVDAIKEDINDNEETIDDWKDEIDTWTMVMDKLAFILDVLYENKEQWELTYKNS